MIDSNVSVHHLKLARSCLQKQLRACYLVFLSESPDTVALSALSPWILHSGQLKINTDLKFHCKNLSEGKLVTFKSLVWVSSYMGLE